VADEIEGCSIEDEAPRWKETKRYCRGGTPLQVLALSTEFRTFGIQTLQEISKGDQNETNDQ
jgi:hypothetical protein